MYTKPKRIDDLQAVALFKKATGHELRIDENHETISYVYKGVVYNIKRDDENGTIHYGEHRYTVKAQGEVEDTDVEKAQGE
jgi:hypothetical protein